jgi:hypothetical protein
MTLAELKSNIAQKTTTGGELVMSADLSGAGAIADFIQTLPSKLINLSGTVLVFSDYESPQGLLLTGTLTDSWILAYFSNTALKNVNIAFLFTQATGADPITGSLTCLAEVPVSSTVTVKVQGALALNGNLLFDMVSLSPGFSPLPSILSFTGNDTLLSYIPAIDVFKRGNIKAFNLAYGFSPAAVASLKLALDLGADWPITDNIGIKNIGLSATVNYKPRKNGSIERSFDAAASGIIHIGQDFFVAITLENSTQWYLEVIPANGNILPSMADVCDLAGGASLWQSVQNGLNSLKISEIAVDGVKIGFDYAAKKVNYFSLKSHVTIAGVQINTQTQLPDFRFGGNLAPGNTISLKAIIAYYFGVSDGFPEINVTEFTVFARPGNGYYTLETSISTDWQFIIANGKAIALQTASASVEYTKTGASGSVSVTFAVAGIALYLSAAYNATDGGWLFKGGSNNNSGPVPAGGVFKELGDYFGIGLPQVLTNATISNLNLSFNTGTKDFTFVCFGQLPFSFGTAEIEFNVAITYKQDNYAKNVDGKLTINDNVFTFSLSADDATTTIVISYKGQITLAHIAQTFTFGQVAIPETLNFFKFNDMDASLDTKTGDKQFSGSGTITINDTTEVDLALSVVQESSITTFSGAFELAIEGFKTLDFTVAFVKNTGGYDITLGLDFTVAGVNVILAANVSSAEKDGIKTSDKSFSGGTKGLNIQVSDILKDLLQNIFPDYQAVIPADFLPDFVINDIFISYSGNTGGLYLLASSTVAGKDLKFFFNYTPKVKGDAASKSSYAFGIETEVAGLGGLPLVGEQLKDVNFTNAGFVYASADGEFAIPSLSTSSTGVSSLVFEDPKSYQKGFNLMGELIMGHNLDPLSILLPLASSNSGGKDTAAPVTPTASPSFQPGVKWINIDKALGPVKLNKVGFSFSSSDKMLALLINAQLGLSGLTFSVEGLGLAFLPLSLFKGDPINPEFRLSGLGLAISKGPLNISGMFVKVAPGPDEDLAFYGAAEISAAKFGISGVGSYSQGKKGIAFFIYAMYNGPIGGPSFFFVTGIAAGFGYNKTVRLPEIQEVKDFPLVAMALSGDGSKTILDVLSELIDGNWIPTSYGDYWLAVGIKFTTFKIVNSFVLLIVEFGTKLEFAIMGLSLLKWPDSGSAIVYVELAILARFGPDSDVIAVQAILTSNSYVFDPNCKLTGGFAFYTWISGPHEGDFVITLGGYHPRYPVPDYYPQVDRLGLNWKIGSIVSITGEMYYALTPSAIMAGGLWEVVCDLSFLRASVTMYADVLISWAPFYYRVDGGITVRIEANIDILFVTVHFSLSMGAEVHIWGPPFAGEIYVDWTIFSFSIPFGSSDDNPPAALQWDEFAAKFIPQKDNADHPLDTRIAAGIVDTIQDENGKPIGTIIDPYNFTASVESFFPVKELYTDGENKDALPEETWMDIAGQDMPAFLSSQNDDFGIKPMNLSAVTTQLNARLVRKNNSNAYEAVTDNVTFIASAKGMAGALWGNDESAAPVIRNVPAGIQLHTTEPVDDTIISIDLSAYEEKDLSPQIIFLQNSDAYGKLDPAQIDKLISDNINNPARKKVADDLLALGFDTPAPPVIAYQELEMETPFYVAAIGQNITDIIKS